MQDAPKWYSTHGIELLPDTRLKKIFHNQNIIRVNSFHHQAVRVPAPGFQVGARSQDGVIEAIESTSNDLWLGVQWHPECMWEKDRLQLELFKWLVSACNTNKTY
jgi:putative glutamine amidotransferase